MEQPSPHPVDELLPFPRLIPLGLQHVLVMYAGAVAVPLIIGRALKLPPEQVAILVNADLFACGVVTLIQSIGIGPFGIRLPVMMGVTFASVAPMLAMANNPALGLGAIYGSVIAAGIFGLVVAPFMSALLRFFPPVVTGTIIAVIGISLMRIGVNWAAGAAAPNLPGYGDPSNLLIAAFVLVAILLITKFGKGFVVNVAVLLGIILGFVVAWLAGKVSFADIGKSAWLDVVYPFQLATPTFDVFAILTMCLVMLVVMVESTGMFLAVGEMTDRKIEQRDLTRGLLTDGLGTLIGGIFNTFPYLVLAERRPRRRHRREEPLGDRRGRRHPADPRPDPQAWRGGHGRSAVRARRRRHRHVRNGSGDWNPHPRVRRLQDQPLQPVHRGDCGRLRHDSAGGAGVFREASKRARAVAQFRHCAGCDRRGPAERLFQRGGITRGNRG